MDNVIFYEKLEHISLKWLDLRTVGFQSPINTPYLNINLEYSQLSTHSFKGLRSAYLVDFIGVNFKEVNFQDPGIRSKLSYLDMTRANLESCDLSKLNLQGIVLPEANLAKTNLFGADIKQITINPGTNLEASQWDLANIDYLYRGGIKNFANCKIYTEKGLDDVIEYYTFQQINFKKTQFLGESININFINCQMEEALFSVKNPTQAGSSLSLNIAVKESQLDGVTFRRVKFVNDSLFLDTTFTQLNFDQVEMPAKILFALYDLGQRDFMGVKDLKGSIPQKLVAFPVLGAKLKKESFLHLYRQGLRDFRGSNLNSFYLSQVLTEQAISAIDLKLEGAEYKASPLGCTSSTTRHTRSPIAFCKLHFLFQKTNVEQSISLADIEDFSVVRRERFSFKELVLGPNPLYLIPDDVNEINFYWGYRPDDDVLIKLNNFIKATTVSFETVELKNIDLRFHFAKKFSDTTSLSEFANAIKQLGFLNMKLTYYTQQMQLSRLEVKNGIATISLLSVTQDEVLATQKFRAVSNNVKLTTLKSFDKEAYRARLRRINSEVLRKLGSGIRTGIRNGAQYEIGATIIFFIGEAINNPGTNEPVILPAENKTALKELAYFVAEEIGQQRGADARQINLTTSVAAQCIDRGECSTEEHVIRDVADSLHRLRPDLMIGK